MTEAADRRSLAYTPALDGLRAVAVAAVFAWHLDSSIAAGGFLGVDVFFVLSGYLITRLLLGEWEGRGRIDLRAFWERRARRLVPAMLLLLAALSALVAALESGAVLQFRGDAFATLLYAQNWWLILRGESYFDLFSPSPLRHAWSLAIEGQFYLLWPLVVRTSLRRRGEDGVRCVFWISIAGAMLSALWMAFLFEPDDPSRAYYGTFARAQTLLVGAALAARSAAPGIRAGWWAGGRVTGPLAFATCVACMLLVSEHSPGLYRGGLLLFSIGAGGVISDVGRATPSMLARLLSVAPLRWLGWISYGVYLWHWPVILFATPERLGCAGGTLAGIQILSTLLLSTASYLLIERPVRAGVLRHLVALRVAVASVVLLSLSVLLVTRGGSTTPTALDSQVSIPVQEPDAAGASRKVPSVAIVGDSTARQLGVGLARLGKAMGFRVVNAAIPACGFAVPFPVRNDGAAFPWSDRCASHIGQAVERVRDADIDLFVLLSTNDLSDQRVDGRHVTFGSLEGSRLLLSRTEELVDELTRGGAHMALLTVATRSPGPAGWGANDDPERRAARYRDLLEHVVRPRERVAIVDYAERVCPGGPPCPRVVQNRTMRPDGLHLTDDDALRVSIWLLADLVAIQPEIGTASGLEAPWTPESIERRVTANAGARPRPARP